MVLVAVVHGEGVVLDLLRSEKEGMSLVPAKRDAYRRSPGFGFLAGQAACFLKMNPSWDPSLSNFTSIPQGIRSRNTLY
jgi:hypothetical protein